MMSPVMSPLPIRIGMLIASPVFRSLVAGVLCAMALPPTGFVPLFFVGFPILLHAVFNAETKRKAFGYAWLFGFAYHVVGLYWISNALLVDFALFWWALPFSFFGLPFFLAFFTGFAGLFAAVIGPPGHIARFLAMLALFAGAEVARGLVLTGFPWNQPGSIWAGHDVIAQVAAFVGLDGLSVLTCFWASLLFVVVILPKRYVSSYILLACVIAVSGLFAYVGGNMHLNDAPRPSDKPLQEEAPALIHIVQPNIPQREKWNAEKLGAHFTTHIELSYPDPEYYPKDENGEPAGRPTLIVWPETSFGYFLFEREEVKAALRRVLGEIPGPTYLAAGYLDRSVDEAGKEVFFNSLVIIDENAEIVAKYDKHHLVPFGEYMPYQDELGWLPLVQLGGFEAGDAPAPMKAGEGLPRFIPSICYEIIFARYLQAAPKTGMILNVTNDAWYGNSAGPYQHLAQARFRAIEQSAYLIRAANTGISAIIDPRGRIVQKLNYGNPGSITYGISSQQVSTTMYQKIDMIFAYAFIMTIFLLSFLARLVVK